MIVLGLILFRCLAYYSQRSSSLSESASFSLYSLIFGKQVEQMEYSCKVASSFTLYSVPSFFSWQLWQVKEVRVGFKLSLVFFRSNCQQGWHNFPSGSSRTSKDKFWFCWQ